MPHILFRYFLADADHPVSRRSRFWTAPLPIGPGASPDEATGSAMTYGDYFTAVHAVLSDADFALVHAACASADPAWWPPTRLSIYLSKHGAFYHPARVVAEGRGDPVVFGVTVAASTVGCERIESEARLLSHLRDRFDAPVVPAVYGLARTAVRSGYLVPMFVGQWFDGFDEFHLSPAAGPAAGPVLWQPGGPRRLSPPQVRDLYARATAILTAAYDPMTSEHIQGWHHAAGDFIARPMDGDRMALRLITARRYGPLAPAGLSDPEDMIFALALFFLTTTVRMRLDRADGVGPPLWAGPEAVTGAVAGFFGALDRHETANPLLTGIGKALGRWLVDAPAEELAGLTAQAIARQVPTEIERNWIDQQLADHVDLCRKTVIDSMGSDGREPTI